MQRARLKQYQWYLLDSVQLTAIALTAVALMSAGAHVFDMSANLSLKQEDYVTLQSAHHGWALFVGAMLLSASAIGFHAYLVRGNRHVARLVDRRARANLPGAAHVLGRRLSHRRGDRRLDGTAGRFRKRATAMGIRLRCLRSVELHRPAGACPLDRGQPPRRQHGDPRFDRARRGRARRTHACAVHGRRRQAASSWRYARRIERPSSQLSGIHWYIHVSERVSSPRRR